MAKKPKIADMAEINAFWSDVIRNDGEAVKDRLKASELRARAERELADKTEAATPQKGAFEVKIVVVGES